VIARVAQFRFPSLHHRREAERNGSERVGPSLARQKGFQAIYYGRIGELEAFSISLFDSRETAEVAGVRMNAEPLIEGQQPEMLPTPVSVVFHHVERSLVRDMVPTVGALSHLKVAPGMDERGVARWNAAFAAMLEGVPGLCQAYLLKELDSAQWITLTFWTDIESLKDGSAVIRSWQASEASAGRPPAFVGTEPSVLTDLRLTVAGVPSTMPTPV
jgi:heme-degrading monooxygenase HmoA